MVREIREKHTAGFGFWLVDAYCSDSFYDTRFYRGWESWRETMIQKYGFADNDWEIDYDNQELYEEDIALFLGLFPHLKLFVWLYTILAPIGVWIDDFWFRPWLTSPGGKYDCELFEMGREDSVKRTYPRFPKNEIYMKGWMPESKKNPQIYVFWGRL